MSNLCLRPTLRPTGTPHIGAGLWTSRSRPEGRPLAHAPGRLGDKPRPERTPRPPCERQRVSVDAPRVVGVGSRSTRVVRTGDHEEPDAVAVTTYVPVTVVRSTAEDPASVFSSSVPEPQYVAASAADAPFASIAARVTLASQTPSSSEAPDCESGHCTVRPRLPLPREASGSQRSPPSSRDRARARRTPAERLIAALRARKAEAVVEREPRRRRRPAPPLVPFRGGRAPARRLLGRRGARSPAAQAGAGRMHRG